MEEGNARSRRLTRGDRASAARVSLPAGLAGAALGARRPDRPDRAGAAAEDVRAPRPAVPGGEPARRLGGDRLQRPPPRAAPPPQPSAGPVRPIHPPPRSHYVTVRP